jgi:hypothetical protein
MKQRPSWEANNYSATPEIPYLLWNLQNDYHGIQGECKIMCYLQKFPSETSEMLKTVYGEYWTGNTNKLWGFSPPMNYTDQATAACRRS